jgi:hypothetical protein
MLHRRGSIEYDEDRIFEYVGSEIIIWYDINSKVLNLFDIESMVKKCKHYHTIARLPYLKYYEGMKNLNLTGCHNPLTIDSP